MNVKYIESFFNNDRTDDVDIKKFLRGVSSFLLIKINYDNEDKDSFNYCFQKYYLLNKSTKSSDDIFKLFWNLDRKSGKQVFSSILSAGYLNKKTHADVTYASKFANIVSPSFPIFDKRIRTALKITSAELDDIDCLVADTKHFYEKLKNSFKFKYFKNYIRKIYGKYGINYVRLIDFIIWSKKQ